MRQLKSQNKNGVIRRAKTARDFQWFLAILFPISGNNLSMEARAILLYESHVKYIRAQPQYYTSDANSMRVLFLYVALLFSCTRVGAHNPQQCLCRDGLRPQAW